MPSYILLRSLLLLVSSLSFTCSGDPTAYELLESHDFPKGLLPRGVESYLLQTDGRFDVFFDGECQFKVEGEYLLRYKRRISGTLEAGALKHLNGVSVRLLFIWFPIGEVLRTGDELVFYAGPIRASFPAESLDDCPKCRGGFDRRIDSS